MAAMTFNRGVEEYAIESPDGEMGVSVPYGELANLAYEGHTYIAYCEDQQTGDTQIYRLAGPTLLSGLELVETEVADTEFDAEDGGDGDGDGDEDPEDVENTEDGEDDDDTDDDDTDDDEVTTE